MQSNILSNFYPSEKQIKRVFRISESLDYLYSNPRSSEDLFCMLNSVFLLQSHSLVPPYTVSLMPFCDTLEPFGCLGVAWVFSKDAYFHKLTKSFKSEASRPKNVFPKWDLVMILNFINQHLFEPLSKVELKFLTLKTVFLVTVALGASSSRGT